MLERNQEALDTLEQALERDPDNAWNWGTKGQVLRALDRLADAESAFREAVKLDPDLAWTHSELGETLRMLDRPAEALDAFERRSAWPRETPWQWAAAGGGGNAERYDEGFEGLARALTLETRIGAAPGPAGCC